MIIHHCLSMHHTIGNANCLQQTNISSLIIEQPSMPTLISTVGDATDYPIVLSQYFPIAPYYICIKNLYVVSYEFSNQITIAIQFNTSNSAVQDHQRTNENYSIHRLYMQSSDNSIIALTFCQSQLTWLYVSVVKKYISDNTITLIGSRCT